MIKRIFLPLGCIALLACGPRPEVNDADSQPGAAVMENDGSSIKSLYASWYAAMQNGDVTDQLKLLAPGFAIKTPGQPMVTDRDKLREALEAFHANYTETVSYEIREIEITNGTAWVLLSETATLTPRGGGDAVTVSGIHLAILKRAQPESEWKIFRDISSFDQPE